MPTRPLLLLLRAALIACLLCTLGCSARRSGGGGGGGGDDDDSAGGDDDDLFPDDDDTASDDDDTAVDDDDTSVDDDDTAVDDDDTSVDDDDTAGSDYDGDGWDEFSDCDDFDPTVHPGATELCDGQDNDCNGSLPANETDPDFDGWWGCDGDCAPNDGTRYPGAFEQCDGVDNNCDGSVPSSEDDYDGDGWWPCDGDCDDFAPSTFPGASEICGDFVDQDCNGADLPCTGSCPPATDVSYNGHCYYLDGSGGSCVSGYTLAPQSILNSIATMFVGKTYRTGESDNCCIWHANQGSENQDWGMPTNDCNVSGQFTQGPTLGGSACTDALNTYPDQLTLCQSL
jgi:hypothetical protein